jgi:hypothetical protein
MTVALKPARQHSYRLSAYERKANDFYPTPSDLAIGLTLGLPRLGLGLPRVALDPCCVFHGIVSADSRRS